jgi:hypothetical protein
LAITAAASLLVGGRSSAKVLQLGVITHAERAHVGEAAASAGSTIYEGDRLSTEDGGILRISSPGLTLQLNAQSFVTLRHPASPEGGVVAELASGTLVFASARTANIVVMAGDALIHPAADASTMTQIRVVNRKELRISAQRGATEFSYHGESETIPEGKTCRVLLDPSETDASAALGSPTKHHKFLLLEIGIAAGIAIPVLMHALESPDHP